METTSALWKYDSADAGMFRFREPLRYHNAPNRFLKVAYKALYKRQTRCFY